MTQFSIRPAKRHFPKLVQQALAGAEIVITKAGQPAIRVMPIDTEDDQRHPAACAANPPSKNDCARAGIE
jgi:prevent-host-death family protein